MAIMGLGSILAQLGSGMPSDNFSIMAGDQPGDTQYLKPKPYGQNTGINGGANLPPVDGNQTPPIFQAPDQPIGDPLPPKPVIGLGTVGIPPQQKLPPKSMQMLPRGPMINNSPIPIMGAPMPQPQMNSMPQGGPTNDWQNNAPRQNNQGGFRGNRNRVRGIGGINTGKIGAGPNSY